MAFAQIGSLHRAWGFMCYRTRMFLLTCIDSKASASQNLTYYLYHSLSICPIDSNSQNMLFFCDVFGCIWGMAMVIHPIMESWTWDLVSNGMDDLYTSIYIYICILLRILYIYIYIYTHTLNFLSLLMCQIYRSIFSEALQINASIGASLPPVQHMGHMGHMGLVWRWHPAAQDLKPRGQSCHQPRGHLTIWALAARYDQTLHIFGQHAINYYDSLNLSQLFHAITLFLKTRCEEIGDSSSLPHCRELLTASGWATGGIWWWQWWQWIHVQTCSNIFKHVHSCSNIDSCH